MTLRHRCFLAGLLPLTLSFPIFGGCRSVRPQPPMNLSEPGWTIRQGQAVWRTKPHSPDIAGELLVAMHRDGRSVVQFFKPPLPFVDAQRDTNSWQIRFYGRNKTYAGRGPPPKRILWLQLPVGLVGHQTGTNWFLTWPGEEAWHFEDLVTEEMLEGFLVTTALPQTHLVQSGETLPGIACWYGVTPESIQTVNPGPASAWLKAGNPINLPVAAPRP